ncbi:hypothetical protein [Lacisediminimonas profundi]|uniref:hypothetical protein n=1 Tax=Lacisediminimonas profundi TaxID=2603856 RepID=UPI00124BB5CE|nr:hypothetical protein [Lacisediminimonas profundi]
MSDRPGQRIDASAFRAPRFAACPRQLVRIRNGPVLPSDALPARPIPTDTAAAPRPLRGLPRVQPAPAPRAARQVRPEVLPTVKTSRRQRPVATPRSRHPREPAPWLRAGPIALSLMAGLAIGLASAWWLSALDTIERASLVQRPGTAGEIPPVAAATASVAMTVVPAAVAISAPHAGRVSSGEAGADDRIAGEQPPLPAQAAVDANAGRNAEPGSRAGGTSALDQKIRKDKKKRESRHDGRGSQLAQAERAARRIRPPATAVLRGEEIDRLKSQAFSESSRDRTRRGPPPPSAPGASIKPVSTANAEGKSHAMVRRELARCEKLASLFGREWCKWQTCSNQWGTNGCPSFTEGEAKY